MSANWTANYAMGMGGLVVVGFWLAAFLLSIETGGASSPEAVTAIKSVGLFSLAVSLCAATTLLATLE